MLPETPEDGAVSDAAVTVGRVVLLSARHENEAGAWLTLRMCTTYSTGAA